MRLINRWGVSIRIRGCRGTECRRESRHSFGVVQEFCAPQTRYQNRL
jgi:hypothetical protein